MSPDFPPPRPPSHEVPAIHWAVTHAYRLAIRYGLDHLADEAEAGAIHALAEVGMDAGPREIRRAVGRHVGRVFRLFREHRIGWPDGVVETQPTAKRDRSNYVHATLDAMPKRDAAYLRRAYGIGGNLKSQVAIAREFGASRSTVRRAIERAKADFAHRYRQVDREAS